jgi:hypothetical protein
MPPEALGIASMRRGERAVKHPPQLSSFALRSSRRAALAQKINSLAQDSKPDAACLLNQRCGFPSPIAMPHEFHL